MDTVISRNARFLAFSGVTAIAFGVIVLFWPNISLVALIALFGAFALIYGALMLGQGLNLLAHQSTDWVPYTIGGLAGAAIGAIAFFRPGVTALVLVYFIAAWAIMTGIFEILAAIDMHGEFRGEWWLVTAGALSLIFGGVIAIFPGAGVFAIMWLISFYVIVGGAMRLVAAYRLHTFQTEVKNEVKKVVGIAARPTPQS